jgi:hypothetical protein
MCILPAGWAGVLMLPHLLLLDLLLHRYEFGKVTADGRRDVMVSGRAPSATLTGLALSTAGVYVCAVDTDGAKVSRNHCILCWGPSWCVCAVYLNRHSSLASG